MRNKLLPLLVFIILMEGCFYVTNNQKEVLIQSIDVNQTLKVAEHELKQDKWGRVLTLWAIRDQHFSPNQAESVAELYFSYIDSLHRQFNIWHLTWAVANIHRNGDEQVKQLLDSAYHDAVQRADTLHRVADRHVNGDKVYMGDFHFLGRRYKKTHVVAPGNSKYPQSAEEVIDD
ncbi:MAG: hypothetical protein ACOC41_07285 [Chitinivibrionales bacterium]